MADFAAATAAPPHTMGAGAAGPGAGGASFKKPDAFADAVQRARQVSGRRGEREQDGGENVCVCVCGRRGEKEQKNGGAA